MVVFFAVGAILLVLTLWSITSFNNLVKLSQLLKEGWSGIDVQLKRRYDLIPNLVATVKSYAAHESGVFESVTSARAASMQASSVAQKSDAETDLSKSLVSLFAVAENYPELKANQNFLELQSELSSLESEIQLARRYYNGTARNYNIAVQTFPGSIVASIAKYNSTDYFQLSSSSERDTPEVKF